MAKPKGFPLAHRWALLPQGLRVKLVLAFVLMSVIPILMLLLLAGWFALPSVRDFYQLERWFPLIANPSSSSWWLIGLLALTIFIAFLGTVYLTIKLIEPVIRISQEAKQIAQGDVNRELTVEDPGDELGDLTGALNQLTSKIRTNMSELKQYGERTNELNMEIQKRVVTLSALLQIGELIGGGAEVDAVLDLIVEKLGGLDSQGFGFLCLQHMEDLALTLRRASQLELSQLGGLPFDTGTTVIDAAHPPAPELQAFWEQMGKPNLVLQPVGLRNRRVGLLGAGNRREGYTWSPEWIDTVNVFVKHTSIAVENELLLRKTKSLAIRDELTGVYNENYIRRRLDEEIKRAIMYQRPCAVAMFTIDDFESFRKRHGEPEAERVLKKTARFIQEAVTAIDRVGRFAGNEIVVLLPERNKRQAVEISEDLRRRVMSTFSESSEANDRIALSLGVAENPIDGVTAEDLLEKAGAAMRGAATDGASR